MSLRSEPEVEAHSFSTVFAAALRGQPCQVIGLDDGPEPLPVGEWRKEADATDRAMLEHCVGATIDIGCGPGRMSAQLSQTGRPVLGIDVVREAVQQTRDRGVSAIVRDVFKTLPGEGRWQTALLADGNVGIGGDPVALLYRVAQLIEPKGRVVVDLSPPGVGLQTRWARLHCGDTRSRPFRWARVGVDAIAAIAFESGLAVREKHSLDGRWFAVLERSC